MVLGKLDIHIQKNGVGPFPKTLCQNELKMDQPKTTMLLTENRGRAMIWQ
jgi:hypothetical protein